MKRLPVAIGRLPVWSSGVCYICLGLVTACCEYIQPCKHFFAYYIQPLPQYKCFGPESELTNQWLFSHSDKIRCIAYKWKFLQLAISLLVCSCNYYSAIYHHLFVVILIFCFQKLGNNVYVKGTLGSQEFKTTYIANVAEPQVFEEKSIFVKYVMKYAIN